MSKAPHIKRAVSGSTVLPHEARLPQQSQVERERIMRRTDALVNERVGAYMQEHGKDNHWATPVRAYYQALIRGCRPPGFVKLDPETRSMIREWIVAAMEQTGHKPPPRATEKKKEARRKRR